jgi:hypothetical protein
MMKMIQEQTILNSHTSICNTSHLLDESLSLRKQMQSTTTKWGRRILLILHTRVKHRYNQCCWW